MFVGHQRQIRYLEQVLAKGTLAHAYLFYGPEGVGKRTVALTVARALLCTRPPPRLGGCGECDACGRVGQTTHPDLLILSPDRRLIEEDTQEIGVRQVHELERLLALRSWAGGWRVVVIDQAERMSREAQSALLKTLEEPGPRVMFLLVSARPGMLLPTIHSRCVPLHFTTAGDAALEPLLGPVLKAARPRLLAFADGRPGVLVKLRDDPSFRSALERDHERFSRLLGADLPAQLAFSEAESREHGRLESLLRFVLVALRHRLHDRIVRSETPGNTLPPREIRALEETLAVGLRHTIILETVPVNRRIIADSFFIAYQMLAASQV